MTDQGQQQVWEPDGAGGPTVPAPPEPNPTHAASDAPYVSASAPTVSAMAPAGAELAGETLAGRLPRVEALDLLGRMKATVVVGSLVAFGVFLGLAATHITGVTARAGATGGTNQQGVSPTSPSDEGGFFTGGQNGGFGVGPPGSSGPASGTSVS